MAMMTTHAATNDAGTGRPWRGDDFADWLPPMLVRELRQRIKSGAFFWTFLLLQAALVLHAAFTVLLGLGGWGTLMGLATRGSLPTLAGGWSGLGVAAVVFPLPLLLRLPRLKERHPLYVAVQTVCLVVFGCDAFLRGMPGAAWNTLALVAPFPLAGLMRLFVDDALHTRGTLVVAGLVVLVIVLGLVARPWWREMRETWRLVGPETRP